MSEKKFKPKTKPTGFEPSDRVRKKPPDPKDQFNTSMALRVKVAYAQERSRWESLKAGETVEYRPPKKYDGFAPVTIDDEAEVQPGKASKWQHIADWCAARDINPLEFIRVCFADLPMRELAPEPGQLCGPTYERKWQKLYPKIEERLRLALEVQRNAARDEYLTRVGLYKDSEDAAALYVATTSSIDLSPLFRYCFATSIGTKKMLRVAQKYVAEAILQFECYRKLYKKAWADALPDGFSKMSKELYPVVLAKLGQDTRGYESEDE